jgi:hypothetical protein
MSKVIEGSCRFRRNRFSSPTRFAGASQHEVSADTKRPGLKVQNAEGDHPSHSGRLFRVFPSRGRAASWHAGGYRLPAAALGLPVAPGASHQAFPFKTSATRPTGERKDTEGYGTTELHFGLSTSSALKLLSWDRSQVLHKKASGSRLGTTRPAEVPRATANVRWSMGGVRPGMQSLFFLVGACWRVGQWVRDRARQGLWRARPLT